MSANFYQQFAARGVDPRRPWLWNAEGRLYRYAELSEHSARLANALVALGVKPGDRVAVQVEKSAEALLLYLATLRTGAVFLPLNTAYTLPELEYFLGDAEPALLVCTPEKRHALEPLAAARGVSAVHTLGADGNAGSLLALAARASGSFTDVNRASSELAALLYTSGTTGLSKGAMITHGNLWSNANTLALAWHYRAEDVLLHALPIFHIHGLFVAVNVSLVAGAAMHLLPRFEPDLVFRHLPNCTVMMGVPTFYTRLLQDERLNHKAVQCMRLFVSGSAPLLAGTHRAWQERTGHAILERYGMTETGMNSSNPYEGERVAGTVGLPLPGVKLRITDAETGAVLPAGATGMIEVRGPNVCAGYWRNPEKTAAEFRADGYFITGDLGHIDQRGYLQIVGRGKDLIITGGYNVYPKEVEAALDALPDVVESAVVGLPHADLGEAVTAVVIVPRRTNGLTPDSVISQLKTQLAAYKCPKQVVFMEELPRNTMGKVQKNLLREQLQHLYAKGEG